MTSNKVLTRIIILSLITVSVMYAVGIVTLTNTVNEVPYQEMSTMELQKNVEELSQNGDLPFAMGLELIERWTKK